MSVPGALRDLPDETLELSEDITAYSAEQAELESLIYQDPGHWVDLEVDRRWFVIGETPVGDHWLAGPDGGVWFFAAVHGERSVDLFEPLHISVTEWLILGHALGRFEKLDEPTDMDAARLDALVESISPGLAERYPYELPFA